MHISNVNLFKQALNLSEKDRAALAGLLITSLENKPNDELESLWRLEISQRVSELDNGTVNTIPWEDAKKRLIKDRNAE